MTTYFTTNERELLVMLLEKEEKNLNIEINHVFQRELVNLFRERKASVSALIEKLKINEPAFA